MNILIIQGGTNPNLPSGEKTIILNEKFYLSKYNNVNVEFIQNKSGVLGKISGFIWSFDNYNKVIEFIEKYNPDIIHFHTIVPYLSLSVLYAAKKKNISVVQTLHNGRWLCVEGGYYRDGHYCDDCVGSCGFKGVIRGCGHGEVISFLLFIINFIARQNGRLFKLVDKFIAVSDYVKEQHVKSGFPEDKIVVRNNGVNIDLLKKLYLENNNKEREGIAYAGRISTAKGSKAIKYLIPKIKDKFHIIGTGPQLEELKLLCKENNYNNVKFWGKQSHDKTLSILGSVVCTIVPSVCGDSFPTVAIESMAMSTPVIGSQVGGLTDLLEQSKGGLSVPMENYTIFYNKLLVLLNDTEEAKKVGISGKEYVFTRLTNDLKGQELEEIYKNILLKKGKK